MMRARPATLILSLTLGLVVSGCQTASSAGPPPSDAGSPPASASGGSSQPDIASVPPRYRQLYATLSGNIGNLADQQGAGSVDPVEVPGGPIMAGELGAAAGNRGPALLEPSALAQVSEELDGFAHIAMKGVVVLVSYPMLLPSFPDSASYLQFYEQVARLVATHGMALSIELNPAFSDPGLSSLHPDYQGLTLNSYATGQHEEAQIVIDDLHPRYLTILDEPSTFATTLHQPAIATAAGAVQVLGQELTGLNREGTLVGAGVGTWEDPTIEQAIATQSAVDYLSVHVYPTATSQVADLDQVTTIAASARKPLLIDETWLSKENPSGAPPKGSAVAEQKLKNWSFWEPLDARYLEAISAYAREHGISMVSPFSTELFFGYVDWTQALEGAPGSQVRGDAAQLQQENLAAGVLGPLGRAYQATITSER
ncbi:MAG TPA: hypothetical protein VED63_07895 [Acidimicrobiales bacterium]|nr:hypothetical protein [Acidimicrobiales bacterium]